MKKKLMAILAAFVAVTPLAVVKADIDYTVGTEHNFIINKDQDDKHQKGNEDVGIKIISLGEDPEDSGYVKGLTTGAVALHGSAFFDGTPTSFEDSEYYKALKADFNGTASDDFLFTDAQGNSIDVTSITTPYVKNYNENSKYLTVPTKDEILSWFDHEEITPPSGAIPAELGKIYSLTSSGLTKFKNWYKYSLDLAINLKTGIRDDATGTVISENVRGYVTSSYQKIGDDYYVWVVLIEISGGNVTSVSIVPLSNNDMRTAYTGGIANPDELPVFMIVPVLSLNKTYNCKFEVVHTYSCYKCDDKYQWLEVGTQSSTCTIVSSVTSKAKCTDNPKTGVEDYILEFAIAAGICGLVLLAVKRKSLFSRV